MNSNNLLFSSKIDPQVEQQTFDLLLNYLSQYDFNSVYVKNVCIVGREMLFFVKIDETETIIRVPIKLD